MRVSTHLRTAAAVALAVLSGGATCADESVRDVGFREHSQQFFTAYCVSCHGADDPEADISLADLGEDFQLPEVSQQWLAVLRQIESGSMPPVNEDQPAHAERQRLVAGIGEQFRLVGRPLELIRSAPRYGNYVNHSELFSGEHTGPAFSRARIWRISPYIDGQSSPFSLSQEEGFKDYAQMWSLDKPTIELLMLNASAAVRKQIGPSEAELKQQDEIWKQQVLDRRRTLKTDVAKQEDLVARNPDNEGHAKRLESLRTQLEKNEATDFEKNRSRPSNKLAGLKRNVLWRVAYGDEFPSQQDLDEAVTRQLKTALRRAPRESDIAKMSERLRDAILKYGNETGTQLTMTSILMMPEAIYRMELGLGKILPDGRRMLSPAEVAYAVGYALTDAGPDRDLMSDLNGTRLSDPAVIWAHVERMYDSAITGTDKRRGKAERVLRFFQEYFGYQGATDVFKDGTRHPGHSPRPSDLVKDTDLLIMDILRKDQQVLKQLLTTDIAFIRHVPSRPGWETISSYNVTKEQVREDNLLSGEKNRNNQRYVLRLAGQRAGILTQPSWLTAHSTNFDNDPVRRGKWIFEHLLGGVIPDVPITVDATVPEDPDKSLRVRFEKTHEAYCMNCHSRMNPLGMAFEMYDDVGRFREQELLRDNKTLVPVDSTGAIVNSGVDELDGPVRNAVDLMQRLAESDHVRQVFVRHAFRYWMGRNETLNDSPTLIAADKAFVDSGGSMKALVASLLSSDSFLYRRAPDDPGATSE